LKLAPERSMSSPLRVTAVIGQLTTGGAEGQMYETWRRLDRARFQPSVVCLSGDGEPYGSLLEEAGVPVRYLQRRGHFDSRRILALRRALREWRSEVVYGFLLDGSAYAAVAAALCGNRPLVTSNRQMHFQRKGLRQRLDAWALNRGRAVVVNSKRVMEFTRLRHRVPVERMVVLYNGVDTDRFAEGNRAAVRAELGLEYQAILVGTAGSLTEKKDHALLLETARALRERFPEVRYAIAGDGPLRVALSEACREAGLDGTIHLLGTRGDVPDLLAALDVFVLSSRQEGFPNVVLEAMAAGKAILTTDAGGVREMLLQGDSGVIVPPGDPAAFAEALAVLLADPPRRRALGNAARKRVRQFRMERMVSSTEALLERVAGRVEDAARSPLRAESDEEAG
jgi:glycosyltransferase involved in cell wall biosynthesis